MARKRALIDRMGLLVFAMAIALMGICATPRDSLAEGHLAFGEPELILSSEDAHTAVPSESGEESAAELPLTADSDLEFSEEEALTYDAPAASTVPIFRLYNKRTSEHLYTKNYNEYSDLPAMSRFDWVQEGIAWHAPASSSVPVYRLYNKRSGDHHYTTDANERNALSSKHGWKYETIGFYGVKR